MQAKIWQVIKVAFAIPLLLVVLSDYARLLIWWGQVALCAYILAQALALLGGVALGMYRFTEPTNKWLEILEYRIVKFLPTISLGADFLQWALSKESISAPVIEVPVESPTDSTESAEESPGESPCLS